MRYVVLLFALLASLVTNAKVAKDPPISDSVFIGDLLTSDRKQQEFINTPANCKKNNTCDLKRVFLRSHNFLLTHDPKDQDAFWIHGTQILAGIETERIEDLTNYAFVQFIRGCMWYSLDKNGQIITEFGVVRNFIGMRMIQHVIPNWVVDTDTIDPIYGTDVETGNRHYFLQSQDAIPSWIPDRQGRLFGEERFTIPFGYVTDHPGPALYESKYKQATNMSLEFEMCLFKTADVPQTTDGMNVERAKALVCFPWEAKHVFNHKTLNFEKGGPIHKECSRPFNDREKFYHQHQIDRWRDKQKKASAEQ